MTVQRVLDYDSFFCDSCRLYVYEESTGDPSRGLPARTRVDSLPNTWRCPWCGADKTNLRACTLVDDYLNSDRTGGDTDRKRNSQLVEATHAQG